MSSIDDTFHTDLQQNSLLERALPRFLIPYSRLARLDRPIGVWLLLFPCLWSLALAAEGLPSLAHILLYGAGALLMRGAGCTYNDMVDADLDKQVARTRERPLPAKLITRKQAAGFLGIQLGLAFLILIQLPSITIVLGFLSLTLVLTYPWMKRVSYWPQLFLGLTFNWGALMGWSSEQGTLAWPALLLYGAGIFWTLIYDTLYAHQDREDDLAAGIKSTALKFGPKTKGVLGGFSLIFLGLLASIGSMMGLSAVYYMGLCCVAVHLAWQLWTLDIENPQDCLQKFKSNTAIGWLYLASILGGKFIWF